MLMYIGMLALDLFDETNFIKMGIKIDFSGGTQ